MIRAVTGDYSHTSPTATAPHCASKVVKSEISPIPTHFTTFPLTREVMSDFHPFYQMKQESKRTGQNLAGASASIEIRLHMVEEQTNKAVLGVMFYQHAIICSC